jgi:hypothetical protein
MFVIENLSTVMQLLALKAARSRHPRRHDCRRQVKRGLVSCPVCNSTKVDN